MAKQTCVTYSINNGSSCQILITHECNSDKEPLIDKSLSKLPDDPQKTVEVCSIRLILGIVFVCVSLVFAVSLLVGLHFSSRKESPIPVSEKLNVSGTTESHHNFSKTTGRVSTVTATGHYTQGDDGPQGKTTPIPFPDASEMPRGINISTTGTVEGKTTKMPEDILRPLRTTVTVHDTPTPTQGATETASTAPKCGTSSVPRNFTLTEQNPLEFVVHGAVAEQGAWPWQVHLRTSSLFSDDLCGGTIIDEHWVLTAAHCLPSNYLGFYGYEIEIRAGSINRKLPLTRPEVQVYTSDHAIKHPNFTDTADELLNDIALVYISTGISFNDRVRPACLPQPGEDVGESMECFATGWGKLHQTDTGLGPRLLRETKMEILTLDECQNTTDKHSKKLEEKFPPLYKFHDFMICAGTISGEHSTCYGDSGGPLVCRDEDNTWTVYGVTSWGRYCHSFSVFTKVTSYLNWIHQQIENQNTQSSFLQ